MKLTTKSTLFFAGFLILLGAAIIFYVEVVIDNTFRAQAASHFHITAEQTKNAFLAYIDGTKTETLDWVSGTALQEKARMVLDAPQGSSLRTRRAQEFIDYVVRSKMPFDKTIVLVDLLDKSGTVIASTNPARIGVNEAGEKTSARGFQQIINAPIGEIYTKSILFEKDEYPDPMVHTLARLFITTPQGEFKPLDGALLIHFSSMDKISKILRGESTVPAKVSAHETFLTSYQTSDIYLVNEDRLLVTHARDGSSAGQQTTIDTLPVRECLENSRDTIGEYDNYLGARVFGTSECLTDEGVILIIEAAKDEVFAPLTTLIRATFTGGALILVLGITIIFFFVRRPLANIDEIVRAAQKVSAGDLTTEARVHTKDELGYLATVFNKMVIAVRDVEKTLRSSKEEVEKERTSLKRAQEVAHMGSWELDLKKNELVWSDEVYRIFGVPSGQALTYEAFLGFVHPDDRAYVDREWHAALKGKPYDIEHRIVVNGTTKWVRERATLEVNAQGELILGSGTVQDITDRKKAEENLQTLVSGLVGATGIKSLQNIAHSIASWLKIDVVIVGELVEDGSAIHALAMVVDGEDVLDYRYALKGTPCEDVTLVRKEFCAFTDNAQNLYPNDTELKRLNISGYVGIPLINEHGKMVGIINALSRRPLAIEPTDRKILDIIASKALTEIEHIHAEEELRISRARYLSALDSMLEGCTILSYDWKFLYVNDQAVKHIRKTREELNGKTLFETYPGIEGSPMHEAFKRCMAERTPQRLEAAYVFPDGYTGWYDLSVIPITEGIFILSIDITERKKAGETLLKLNTAVQSSGEAIFMTDPKGTITFINPEFTKLYGYTTEEIIGKSTPRILKSGRQLPAYYEKFWGSITKGQTVTSELVNKAKDGRLIEIEESVNPVIEDSGVMMGYLAIHRDITERKKVLQDIRENEEKFRSVYEGSNDAIILLTEHEFFDCNKRALEMFGILSKEDFFKLHPADISPYVQPNGRNSAALSQEKIEEAFEKGLSRFDWVYKHTSGMEIPAEVLLVAFPYKNERVLQATVRDMTERKRTEDALYARDQALERANKELRNEKEAIQKEKVKDEALLVSIGEGMIATDETGRVITINPAAERLLGWSAQEILGRIFTDSVTAFDEQGTEVPSSERLISRTLATRKAAEQTTLYFTKKDGGRIPVTITVNPVILGDDLIGTIAIFRDITKEKELEETRRDLLSLASHQLRTPLSGTKWLIETLRRGIHGTLTDTQREYLDEIYKINERMTTLVFDMLNVLRMESGVVPTERREVSTEGILKMLTDTLGPAAKLRGVTLSIAPHDEYTLVTDPALLRNILENFVANAINYSPTGTEVTVRIEPMPGGVTFAIKDSGIGIPSNEQAQIFKRFYRASNAKTYNTRGTGLGLYIASILSKKIGALLSFESEVGKGSTFYAYVPFGDKRGLS